MRKFHALREPFDGRVPVALLDAFDAAFAELEQRTIEERRTSNERPTDRTE
ncbi:MAG: hypothetical protein KDI82_12195 [Gammaproteobacteria bacterium]|nr:hypothetical protein [Gammaproteobacteria bacterium]